jgi:hypothetical protein
MEKLSVATIVIYRLRVEKILEEFVELEKELCVEHKLQLKK